MIELIEGFDWNTGNRDKCQRHGVADRRDQQVFASMPHVAPDIGPSTSEARYLAIGTTLEGRQVFVAFTLRSSNGARLIRPISAQFMHKKEVDHYEQAIAATDR